MARERNNPPSDAAKPPWYLRPLAFARSGAAWMREKPRTRLPLVSLPPLVLTAAVVAWRVWGGTADENRWELPDLLAALAEEDFVAAGRIAERLAADPGAERPSPGLTLYVHGARIASEAQGRFDVEDRRNLFRIAAGYLHQAREQGLPPELDESAFLHAARCLNQAGRFAVCVRFLEDGLAAGAPYTPPIDRLLAEGYLRLANPEWEKALQHIDRFLNAGGLEDEDRQTALLDRIEILIGLDRTEEAKQGLAAFDVTNSPYASQVCVLTADLLMRQAKRLRPAKPGAEEATSSPSSALLAEAMALLKEVIRKEAIDRPERRHADYLFGVGLRARNDLPGALKHFSAARRLHVGTPSGLSAGLGEAEIFQHLGRDAEALESYRRLLSETPAPDAYSNRWISLDGYRARLLAAYARWLGQQKHAEAIALTRALPPVFPSDRAMQLLAEARLDWASQLADQAETLPARQAEETAGQARKQQRLAGVAYARLALLRKTSREFPDDIWRSAECYLRGRDYRHAARMFQLYLDQDTSDRRVDAQARLGESLLALGELDQALAMFQAVIDANPQHPAMYRARLLAAQAHLERDETEAARRLLRANLDNESLTPQSLEWRDSLFLLGEALFRQGQAREAESRNLGVDNLDPDAAKAGLEALQQCHDLCRQAAEALDEALARYGDAPQATRAWYFLAEAHREAAKYPRKRLPGVALEATRNAVERVMQSELSQAEIAYGKLIERLTYREKSGELNGTTAAPLTAVEQGMLRNAYFGRADALFDLGRYDEAIRAYTLAANRYQSEPAALEAFLQIAGCHRRMQRPAEARGVLEQAKVVLGRIAPDADFLHTTRYGRKQWEDLLELLIYE